MNTKSTNKKRIIIARISFVVCLLSLMILIHYDYNEIRYEKHVKKLEDTYGIRVCIDEAPEVLESEYDVFFSKNQTWINQNLEMISKCLEQMPEGLIVDIGTEAYISKKNGEYVYSSDSSEAAEGCEMPAFSKKNICIVLCDSLYGKMVEKSGCTLSDENELHIVLTLQSKKDIERTFYHEFFHVLETKSAYTIHVGSFTAFSDWNKYNPNEFQYTKETSSKYTLGEEKETENVYFISEYSTKNHMEDKAELFEHLMIIDSKEEFEELMQYPHIKEKTQYMSDVIIEAFPSITEDNCFQWQKWLIEMEE